MTTIGTYRSGERRETLDNSLDVASFGQVDGLEQFILGNPVLSHALLHRRDILHQREVAALRIDLFDVTGNQLVHQPSFCPSHRNT